ncbi:MAG TPA: hypothetical protein VNN12_06195 [Dehalococcoidia bacterium]|nr:hypothetical protein [Dehalococcoidia bacterium]
MTRRPFARSALAPVLLALPLALQAGCYRRVVAAEGLGADAYDISEPNSTRPGVWQTDKRTIRQRTTVTPPPSR